MDRKKVFGILGKITNRNLDDCSRDELTQILLAEILTDVIKELPDRELHSELSYGQAIEILKREGRPIKHESWSDAMIIPKNTGIGYSYFNGTYATSMFVLTENMRDSGWIVLDR